jgi:hypothetical protein
MNTLQTTGLDIPDLGMTKARFDSRTGFYVLDTFARRQSLKDGVAYSQLLFPLETPQQISFASKYRVLFRSFFSDKFMKQETILPKTAPVRRAFIFERPALFKKMFENIGKLEAFPAEHHATVRNAAALFQRNSATRNRKGGRRGTRRIVRPSETPRAVVETVFEDLSHSSQRFLNKTMKGVYSAFWSR